MSIIGSGRVGGALAVALVNCGYSIRDVVYRTEKPVDIYVSRIGARLLSIDNLDEIDADIIFVTTQDAQISSVGDALAKSLQGAPTVFHTSGSLSSEVLGHLRSIGCSVGSIHPLVAVSSPLMGTDRFKGAYFCVEGDQIAENLAKRIVTDLGGHSFTIPAELKALYHASAVMAAGHIVALADAAIETLTACGLDRNFARRILLPLIGSTADNLQALDTADALTGPFARRDVQTFERHLASIEENVTDEIREIYLCLAMRSAELASRSDTDLKGSLTLLENISMAKRNAKC
ncbi:MAG: Rossmann-like and DUF2520 domain-containing protein [Pyrinomonadaceae bacterium]